MPTQIDKREPSIVHVGFQANCSGGWWYHAPNNRYIIQIVPANIFDLSRDERGWRIGIDRWGGMKWGLMVFPAPEAAALHAALWDRIAESMQQNDTEYRRRVKRAMKQFMALYTGKR